jgi:hypothetical protein
MNPHFFFVGKLSREESASAFLATLLEYRHDFRTYLFKMLAIAEPHGPCQVNIEQMNVDIRLDYPTAKVVALIENKVRPGAIQVNQLVRYYIQERITNEDARILSILITPTEGYGAGEATRLTTHREFRETDIACRLTWHELAQFCDLLADEDRDAEFIRGGFNCVLKVIEDAAQEKYPLIGGREIAESIARTVFGKLTEEFPKVGLRFWRGKDYFEIYSIKTDITIYVQLAFRVASRPPYAPLEIPDRDHVSAMLRTQFALSAKGKRNEPLKTTWYGNCEDGIWLGHKLIGKWFKYEAEVSGDASRLEYKLAEMGRSVIRSLEEFL